MPETQKIINFFNQHTEDKPTTKAICKIEVNGCKIEMEVHGEAHMEQAQLLLQTCIESAIKKGKLSAELFAKKP